MILERFLLHFPEIDFRKFAIRIQILIFPLAAFNKKIPTRFSESVLDGLASILEIDYKCHLSCLQAKSTNFKCYMDSSLNTNTYYICMYIYLTLSCEFDLS